MRKLSLIAAFIIVATASAFSQQILVDKYDPFDKEQTKMTIAYLYGDIGVIVARIGSNYALYAYSDDIGCSGAYGNYFTFLFSDGTTYKMEDVGNIECGDAPISTFLIDPKRLAGKTITKMRLRQSEGTRDADMDGIYTIQQLFQAVK